MKLLLENWRKHLKEEDERPKPSVRLEILIDDLDKAVSRVEDPGARTALESIIKKLLAWSAEMMGDDEGYDDEYDGEHMYTPDDSY